MDQTPIFLKRSELKSWTDLETYWARTNSCFLLEKSNKFSALLIPSERTLLVSRRHNRPIIEISSASKFEELQSMERLEIEHIRISPCEKFIAVATQDRIHMVPLLELLKLDQRVDKNFVTRDKVVVKYLEWSPINKAYESNPFFMAIDQTNRLALYIAGSKMMINYFHEKVLCATFSFDGTKIFGQNPDKEFIIINTPTLTFKREIIPEISDNKNLFPMSIFHVLPQVIILVSFSSQKGKLPNIFKPIIHLIYGEFQEGFEVIKIRELELDEEVTLKKESVNKNNIAPFRYLFMKERNLLILSHPQLSIIHTVTIKNNGGKVLSIKRSKKSKIRGFALLEDNQFEKPKIGEIEQKYQRLVVLESDGNLCQFDILDKTMSVQEVKLRNKQPNQILVKMYEKMLYADIVFIVQGEKIPAHKSILVTRCSFFERMFASGMEESHNQEIVIDDVSPTIFKALVKYIYFQRIEMDDKLALGLLEIADKYCFEDLTKECEEYLMNSLNSKNCVDFVKEAKLLSLERVLYSCAKFFYVNKQTWSEKRKQLPDDIDTDISKRIMDHHLSLLQHSKK